MRITGPLIGIFNIKIMVMGLIGTAVLVGSAVAVIYSKHKIRMLHVELQNIHKKRDELNTEWSKLLLEKSTYLADARVEKIAKDLLGMQAPEQVNIIGQ